MLESVESSNSGSHKGKKSAEFHSREDSNPTKSEPKP